MSVHIERRGDQINSEGREIALSTEWPIQDIDKADAEVSRAVRAIRLFYYRQLSLLRQIPYLALEANGRGGWRDEYGRAYGECMMAIHQENETWGSYDLFIELRTGVLIGANSSASHTVITPLETVQFGGESTWNLASDKEIYTKLAHQREEERFNPNREIDAMTRMVQQPYHNAPEEVQRALREKEIDKLKLDELMSQLPIEHVIATLRSQGFDL